MRDCALLHAAHESGLKVITELVINHLDQHRCFQRKKAPPAHRA